ncbi:hypothetical protein [Georgenia faecalis]|uniref:DNA helicase n=1 Tax=Georgenia faecalis TaxID=2483799 RepID=A0ABV9D5N5_9MICO|nr:hypothetical protein [Georgenia faecalis]
MTRSALFTGSGAARRPAGEDPMVALVHDGTDDSPGGVGASVASVPAGAEPTPETAAVEAAAQGWRERLVALGGASPMWDVRLLGDALIDLTAAHPSGIAQLYAGRTTRLTNLVREGAALVAARRGARTVSARAEELAQRHGVAPTFLAVGVATWTEPDLSADGTPHSDDDADDARTGRTVRAPVLLRPVRLAARASQEADFEIDLEPAIEVNSVFVRALRARGVGSDVAAIARSAFTANGFSPRTALHRLAALGEEVLPGFSLDERILIGPFIHPGQVLVEDLDALADELPRHAVVAALAGVEDARAALDVPMPVPVVADRAPQAERGTGDLDPDQLHVIDAVATGAHLFIDAPPGADVPATVAAVLADATASGRRVVYVPGTRRSGRTLARTMNELGLSELLLDVTADTRWRTVAAERLRSGLRPEEPEIHVDEVHALRAELVDSHLTLAGYVGALHVRREPWDASAHDALQALAALTATRPGPRTGVRLPAEVLRRLVGDVREHARERLVRAGSLGAFELRPHDTPWYGARLTSARQAHESLERTQRLAELSLPELTREVSRAAAQTGLETPTTMREWGEQLRMLDGVRSALDVFSPQVFERSAADMVVATASRGWRKEHGLDMPRRVRRRLRKQARDLLRPGRPVADLHGELIRVQAQRDLWRRYCPEGGWPRLPSGMADLEKHAREVRADLDALDPVIGSGAGRDSLLDLPFDELAALMADLGVDGEALRLLPERTAVLNELIDLGLDDLVRDLAERHTPVASVAAEFDLAWWASVLQEIVRSDPALAGYDGPALVALAERFRALDRRHVASLAGPVRRAVARHVRTVVGAHPEEAAQLAAELDAEPNLPQILARHPGLASAIRPAWIVAPMLVPQLLPPGRTIDLLVLDGVQHLPVEQAVGAIARARQVVVVGDSRRGGEGLVAALAPMLPSVTVPTDRTVRAEPIATFLAEHGYADVIRTVPSPPAPSAIRLEHVEGFGMPAPGADAVESVQVEVERVVDRVIDHALSRPEESLAVVALNSRHAERVREAIAAAVADSPAVAAFFHAARPEPFVVVEPDGAAGLRRDQVILTVGFAKTPHGRVLHRFGRVSGPDGLACLVDALDAARRGLLVISCIDAGDLDRSRLKAPGPQLLADLLERAAQDPAPAEPAAAPDPLLLDLAERLWRLGLTVVPQYGPEDGVRIPLAIGHPDLPGELLVAVLTDDAEYVAEPSLRRRERHWVQRLTARGWAVHMAYSTAVFADPQLEARTILGLALQVLETRRRGAAPARAAGPDVPDQVDDGATEPDDDGTRPAGEAGERPDAGGPADQPAEGEAPTQMGDVVPMGEAVAAEASEAPEASAPGAEQRAPVAAEPLPRGPRPEVTPGLPLTAYSDDELDDLAAWIAEDGVVRTDEEVVAALRDELGLTRRGAQVDGVLGAVAARRR